MENMHDKHVIKPGKKRSSMDQTQSLFLPLPFVLRSLRISSPSPYYSLPISFQPLSISFHLYLAPLPMLSAAYSSALSLRLRRHLGSARAALPGATSGDVISISATYGSERVFSLENVSINGGKPRKLYESETG